MNEMQVFKYEDNEVRTVERNGEVWWVLADVCRVLGIQNNRNVARRLDEDEKGVHLMDTLGGGQKLTIISESGLYKVILRSDKPEAKKFTRWVTHEVLPTIRRTGGYGQVDVTAIIMQTATAVCAEMVKQLTPLFQSMTCAPAPPASAEYMILDDIPVKRPRLRKKPASIIDRLCPELRREVEEMLCDGRHTYYEICLRLRQEGISISVASVCRYAKRTGCYATYEAESED